jgi:hypothetical protein
MYTYTTRSIPLAEDEERLRRYYGEVRIYQYLLELHAGMHAVGYHLPCSALYECRYGLVF